MVIVLNHNIKEVEKRNICTTLESRGFKIREIVGEEETILGAVGIVQIDIREVEILPGVDRVIPISKPYKLASREMKKDDTIVPIGPIKVGGRRIVTIAGPCAVESRDQIMESAQFVRESGAVMLRGGAFKPRTSPYAFQGLGEKGLAYLKEAGIRYGMPVVSEIVSPEYCEMMSDYVDLFQIGTRNMQNFELLKRIGSLGRPVMLKRGLAATIEDWLMAAEYLLDQGTDHIILCERGIRTFETYTRNTLDISAIPVVKKLSHLPIIVDPSHATGIRNKVPPVALASAAAGADGLMVEVHPDPENAASDGPQSLFPEQFEKLMRDIEALAPVLGKEIARLPENARIGDVTELQSRITHRVGVLRSDNARGDEGLRGGSDTAAEPEGVTRVAYQGEKGAYSELAIHLHFGEEDVEAIACQQFNDVFESVLTGRSTYGVVPIENSLAGSIHENYDLMLQYPDLKIIGERKIRIIHNLIGFPEVLPEKLERVYSHPQGLAQCAKFLNKYPNIERVPFYDTAGSVAFIAEKGIEGYGAIASVEAAKAYGLTVLKESIETNPRNYTRFFVIARESARESLNPELASLVFSTVDKPGALFACLQVLAQKKLNMKKLESRPILGKPWEYMFYVDVEMPEARGQFQEAVDILRDQTDDFRILGLYKA